MHDLILALCFIAMLVTPAIVAAMSGKRAGEPGSTAAEVDAAAQILEMQLLAAPVIAQRMNAQRVTQISYSEVPTLPLHGTRSLAGR